MWEYTLPGTKKIVIDRVSSKSFIALLPQTELEEVKRDVGAIVDRGEGLVWTDKEAGVFEYPYKVTVVTFKKK